MSEQEWNQARLQALIDNEVEEGLKIDYKGADALNTTKDLMKDITKDVSSFANADGGIIIYGIREDKGREGYPEAIEPIDRSLLQFRKVSKEWLQQKINQIEPLIDGIIIHTIPIDNSSSLFVFVVEIPRSTKPHQAKDLKYYKRWNAIAEPMHDYEINDIRRRGQALRLQIDWRVIETKIFPFIKLYYINALITNMGERSANRVEIDIYLPSHIVPFYVRWIKPTYNINDKVYLKFERVNKLWVNLSQANIGFFANEPILPGKSFDFSVIVPKKINEFPQDIIVWDLFTEETKSERGQRKLGDIPFQNKWFLNETPLEKIRLIALLFAFVIWLICFGSFLGQRIFSYILN